MRVLVTGGAGFVGSTVVDYLAAKGTKVRVIDKEKERPPALGRAGIEMVQGDIADKEAVHRAMKDISVVYHLADSFSNEVAEVLQTDVQGNINLLEAAASCGVKHFLFASTYRVYGRPRWLPIAEEHPLNPEESGRPLYSLFKLTNEKLCLWYWHERGLPVTLFRFWWSFGQEVGGRSLRTLIDTALKGGPIKLPRQAGGDFLHNEDAARAFELATLNSQAYGEAFNISSGTFTSWREMAELVCELTASSSQIELVPPEEWQGDTSVGTDRSIAYTCNLDINKAERLIGYRPQYTPSELKGLLREAVSKLVAARKGR